MEYLTRDPIIEAYFNFRNANEDDVPVFSETVLRLAVKHVLQFKNQREDNVLSMYRMLMTTMLHFNNGKTLEELEEIMICYDRNELMKILDDTENVEDSWKIFTVEEMVYFIRKNAFFIIMSEWVRRFAKLYGKSAINDEKLGDMTLRIHDYFNWPAKSVHQWKRSFESKFLRGNSKEFDDHDLFDITESDLSINKITADLNDKLHPLIDEDNLREFVCSIKSIDSETAHRLQIFKSRHKADQSFVKVLQPKKDKIAEQTIEMFVNVNENAESRPENDGVLTDDDEIEYVHVLEITDDEDKEIIMSNKRRKIETYDDSDEGNNAKEFINLQNDTKIAGDAEDIAQSENTVELIDDEQAAKYLSALQAYTVVNGLFEAIGLLDQVDSIFRTRFEKDS